MLASSFIRFLSLNLDVWDWKTEHLAREVLQKSSFAEIGFLMILGAFFMILGGLGTNFMAFVVLEAGLKFDGFSK